MNRTLEYLRSIRKKLNFSPESDKCVECKYAILEYLRLMRTPCVDQRIFSEPIIVILRTKKRVAGFCPYCGGTVEVRNTFLRRIKGAHCSWCGQKLDVNFKDNES